MITRSLKQEALLRYLLLLWIIMLIFGLTLEVFNYFELGSTLKGDSLGYVLFKFDSIENILSSYRTFGLPLIINIYNFFFSSYKFWPYFVYFLYCFSISSLFLTLEKAVLDKIINLTICSSFLVNHGMVNGLGFLETETIIQVFMVFILSYSIRYNFINTKFNLIILVLLIFYTYQIRPNLGILVFLTPFWLFFIGYFFQRNAIKVVLKNSFLVLFCSLIVLISFISLRYLYTSSVGLAAFGGTVISGQATSYLNQDNIKKLTGNNLILAKKILVKRSELSVPCNKNIFTEEERHVCGNFFIVSAWLSAIELLNGTKVPASKSEDPAVNKDLAYYFPTNNVKIDKLLKDYSFTLLEIENKKIIKRYLYEIKKSIKFYISFLIQNPQFLLFYFIFVVFLIDFFLSKKIQNLTKKFNVNFKSCFRFFLVFQIISCSFLTCGVLSTAVIIHLDPRYLYGLTTFIFPSFIFILPSLIKSS